MDGSESNEHEKASLSINDHGKTICNSTKKQKSRLGEKIRGHVIEYCSKTSIHGLRYLGEVQRPLLERLCWLLAIMLSLAVCSYQIRQLWNRWDQRPVIVSLAEESTPVWKVPFPAITLCNEIKAKRSEVNYTHLAQKYDFNETMTQEELTKLGKMALVCIDDTYKEGDEITNSSIIHYFKEVGHSLKEVLPLAIWRKAFVFNVSSMFSPLLTEEGICYTFNMLDARDIFTDEYDNDGSFLKYELESPEWSLGKGYTKDAGVETYPHRALGSGATAGIKLILIAKSEDMDYLCMGPVEGFKVLLHNPAEIPNVREQYLRVPLNQEVVVSVLPGMMTTSKDIEKYSPHHRQCFFPSERHLRFFKVYTEKNCDLECLSNFTLHMCGCVAFYMPRDSTMPICGSAKIDCMNEARFKLIVKEIEQSMEYEEDSAKRSISECNCLQACTVLYYDAETSQAEINVRRYFQDQDIAGQLWWSAGSIHGVQCSESGGDYLSSDIESVLCLQLQRAQKTGCSIEYICHRPTWLSLRALNRYQVW